MMRATIRITDPEDVGYGDMFTGDRVEAGDVFDEVSYWVPNKENHKMIFLASDEIVVVEK